MTGPSPRSPIANAVRNSARIALWSALALTALAAAALERYARPRPPAIHARIEADQALWHGVDFLAYPEVQLLRKYVQIDSSHPEPDEVAAAEFLAAQLAAAGVRATVERFSDRRANLWAFVEGEDPTALALVGHLDVEPAREEGGWKFPPFSATIEGPWIYGRGMYDMKSLAIAQLLATVDAARRGNKPRRSLLFLQSSSEETGGDTGVRWIFDQHPEVVARIGTVLTEGGVVEALSASDFKYWGIEFAQKRFARMTVCASDRAPLDELIGRLREGHTAEPLAEVPAVTKSFLEAYAGSRGGAPYRSLLTDPEALLADPARFARLTPFMKSLFRDEAAPLAPRRAADGSWEMDIWLHLLPGANLEARARELLPDSLFAGVSVTPLRAMGDAGVSPLDHPDFRTLEAAIRRRYPSVPVGPYFLPWTMTDARHFRARGLPTYGFAPFPVVVSDTQRVGKGDERMQLPAFLAGVALFREAVAELIQ
jgi:acetylornithine deacetylase/succinyl-diaminopimelate desuccinylase-like protein